MVSISGFLAGQDNLVMSSFSRKRVDFTLTSVVVLYNAIIAENRTAVREEYVL